MASQRNFLTIGTDAYLLVEKLSANQRLCRLLEYSSRNPFDDDLDDIDGLDLINKRFHIVPKISNVDAEKKSNVIIQFDGFTTSLNPDFKIATIRFDILCPYDTWLLEDTSLRPHMIMQEIDSMLNGTRITGIGTLQFSSAVLFNIDENIGGYALTYQIHDFN